MSRTEVMAPLVVGAVVSRVKRREVERGPKMPRAETTRAVIVYVLPTEGGREGVKAQLWPVTEALPSRTPLL